MGIKVKLPKVVNGLELADVVESAMTSLENFKVSKRSTLRYEPGSVHQAEESRDIKAKLKAPTWEYLVGVIPLLGWMRIIDLITEGKYNFRTYIKSDGSYSELEIDLSKPFAYDIDATSRHFKGVLKSDFERLVQGIYGRLQFGHA